MKDWLTYSLLSLMCFSLWAIFGKITVAHIKEEHSIVYQTMGGVLVALFVCLKYDFKIATNAEGFAYSVLVGIAGVLGTLFFLFAINKGNTAIVTFITALYPLCVLVVSFFIFKEPISVQQWAAIFCALISIALFASS